MPLVTTLALALAALSAWTERFASLDPATWQVQLYSFPANGCAMRAARVAVADGTLALSVAPAPRDADGKICAAGEIGSTRFFGYGLFRVRMRPPAVRGGVTAFYLMNRWQPRAWAHKEIDIEFIGSHPNEVQLTTHDFQQGGTVWKSSPARVRLPFAYAAGFHEYAILWTPTRVRWYVDGVVVHDEAAYVPHEPLQIRANIYLGAPDQPGVVQWLGAIDPNDVPAVARYADIRYDPLDALPPGFAAD